MKPWLAICLLCLNGAAVLADDAVKQTGTDPELRRELLRRERIDQDARNGVVVWLRQHGSQGLATEPKLNAAEQAEYDQLTATLKKIDSENTSWLKQIVAEHGWPTHTSVGEHGASAAWLLVQHADADPKFQRDCLDQMAKLPKSEISQQNLAYLTDRVLVAEGKKQLYGTQFVSANGKFEPRPLQDEAHVDKLRAEVGLPPLAEYAKQIEQFYGGGAK